MSRGLGDVYKRQVPPRGGRAQLVLNVTLPRPRLWSPDAPALYVAAVTVTHVASATTDAVNATFGVRTVAWSSAGGFRLNGAPLKLRGGCVHHANGPLGSAAVDRADERRVELLKAAGYNAIRTSHNPPSPAFLDACDRLGVVVMDESFDCWDAGKRPNDLSLIHI